ncbi:MAG: DUF6049 family protein [Actinomycetota bacterium]
MTHLHIYTSRWLFSLFLLAAAQISIPVAQASPTAGLTAARIVLTSITPDLVLSDGEIIQVRGQVTNTGTTVMDDVTLQFKSSTRRLGTRDEVARWWNGDERLINSFNPALSLDQSIPVGASATFSLEIPARSIGMPAPEFGVYPIAIEMVATDPKTENRNSVAYVRASIQAQPATRQYESQALTWVVPFVGLPETQWRPDESVEEATARIADAVRPGSRLDRVLDAASTPSVVWAIDPQLLFTLNQLAKINREVSEDLPEKNQNEQDGIDGEIANDQLVIKNYLSRFKKQAPGHEIINLPYGDSDLQALSSPKGTELLASARATGEGTIEEILGVPARSDVIWPAEGKASDQALRVAAEAGYSKVLLTDRGRSLSQALDYSPDARTNLLPGLVGLVGDSTLSDLAAAATQQDATTITRFLAETAANTTERPGLPRRHLILLPRSLDPDPIAFRAIASPNKERPWITSSTLGEIFTPLGERGDASKLPREATVGQLSGVRSPDVAAVERLQEDLAIVSEVLDDPARLIQKAQQGALELLSIEWQKRRTSLQRAQKDQKEHSVSLVNQVSVLPTNITFLRDSGEIQLTVANDLEQAIRNLRLRVVTSNPRLSVEKKFSTAISLPPQTRMSVSIPIKVRASGDVILRAQLITPSNQPLGSEQEISVRVSPTDRWITIGGILLGLILAFGLARAVRKPRRQLNSDSSPNVVI